MLTAPWWVSEWAIRSVLNVPPDFWAKQKWSSSSHFHFLVLVPSAAVIPFVKCNKEIHMLPLKQSPFIFQTNVDRWVDRCGRQMKMERDKWEGKVRMARGWMITRMSGWTGGRRDGWVHGQMGGRNSGQHTWQDAKQTQKHEKRGEDINPWQKH